MQAMIQWLKQRGKERSEYSADWLASLEPDADHSALLERILGGKQPLEHAPPVIMSYPWYSLVDKGYDIINDRLVNFHPEQHYVDLMQSHWYIRGGSDTDGYEISYAAPVTDYVWYARLTQCEYGYATILRDGIHDINGQSCRAEAGKLYMKSWRIELK